MCEDNITPVEWSVRRETPGGKMSCKLDIPLGPSCRDPCLEADLQGRIDNGHRVFAVGDVHGHFATFRALVHRLNLGDEDRVVCLGDMIDRGPDSAGMVQMIRNDPRINWICNPVHVRRQPLLCPIPPLCFASPKIFCITS